MTSGSKAREDRPERPPPALEDFIPLTQDDLDRGLTDEQLEALRQALDIPFLIRELYRLGLEQAQKQAEQATIDHESDDQTDLYGDLAL